MRFPEFQNIMSPARMSRYLEACGGNSKKTMTLYRLNLRLSQELFTIISCLEIALRNAIDRHYSTRIGVDWLRDSVNSGGIFSHHSTRKTAKLISVALKKLGAAYTHQKLVAEMDFGFWRYLYAKPQFAAGGRTLLHTFPAKPRSSAAVQYNNSFVFNELMKINELRNRIAHHEPVCFELGLPVKSTVYARQHYVLVLQLFQWMQINESALLYGLDHVYGTCDDIDAL